MPTVFLSYARQDEAYAKSLKQELTNHEITVWFNLIPMDINIHHFSSKKAPRLRVF